jgi:hypothetical protein
MNDTTKLFAQPAAQASYAAWACKPRRRGLGISATLTGAIIRFRPLALLNVALFLCVASGAGIFLMVASALGATA